MDIHKYRCWMNETEMLISVIVRIYKYNYQSIFKVKLVNLISSLISFIIIN